MWGSLIINVGFTFIIPGKIQLSTTHRGTMCRWRGGQLEVRGFEMHVPHLHPQSYSPKSIILNQCIVLRNLKTIQLRRKLFQDGTAKIWKTTQWSEKHGYTYARSLYLKFLWKVSNSFIHSGYLYSAHSRNLLRGALSPVTVKEKCLKKLAERRHVVLR